jgi:hypothetical protein
VTKTKDTVLLGTRVLTRYAELESYLLDFAKGTYRFLWVTGQPGKGKSQRIQATMRERKHLYIKSGQVTPLALYLGCFEHRDEPIILDVDEMEVMMQEPNGRRLLLALGETTTTKRLTWHSTSPRMGEVPSNFETSSPLCVIANDAPGHAAIRSRARKLEFAPTNEEVHRYAASWFWDQQIHDWFGQHLDRLHPLDLRWYVEAYEDRLAGRDWAALLMNAYALDTAESLVQDLEDDPACPTRSDKERRFTERMAGRKGGSRANYHNVLKRLRKSGRLEPEMVGSIPVRGKRPPRLVDTTDAGVVSEPPADLPVGAPSQSDRDGFVLPIAGGPAPRGSTPTTAEADDTVGWERPADAGDGEDE